ncbi:hypothetical protein [Haloferula sp. BvORR071]|uniref:hypothetical protein n=1 Tax=Haloferula sp. BvORR071 TaxID=1396141 RepID=UPI000556DE62|nr:hypothetical protein [Haloferula sp. BvORR071]
MQFDDFEEPNSFREEPYPWSDLEGWEDFWNEVRSVYSMEHLRLVLGVHLRAGEAETWSDVVGFVSHFLTGQVVNLGAAREWFQERLIQDQALCAKDNAGTCDSIIAPLCEAITEGATSMPASLAADSPGTETSEKITAIEPEPEKSPTWNGKKSPTWSEEESPSDQVPVGLWLVVDREDLEKRLRRFQQGEWCTRVRLSGLLLLIGFIAANTTRRGFSVSANLAQSYISAIKRARSRTTIREPLAVLEKIGVIEMVREAVFGKHTCSSAAYRIPASLLKKKRRGAIVVTPNLEAKLAMAEPRKERRLSAKQPWRARLRVTLGRVSLSAACERLALELVLEKPAGAKGVKRVLEILKGAIPAKVGADQAGHITTSFSNCPRELKPHLLIAGEEVGLCDITAAHFCILPRVIRDGLEQAGVSDCCEGDTQALWEEHGRFVELLSTSDLYREFSEDPQSDASRRAAKERLLKVLNLKTQWARKDPTYRRFQEKFPLIVKFIEQVKRQDHRAIQAPLRHYTAMAVNRALVRLQEAGVDAIPDSDCLICPQRHRDLVCRILGKEIFLLSGVRCIVGGRRFQP